MKKYSFKKQSQNCNPNPAAAAAATAQGQAKGFSARGKHGEEGPVFEEAPISHVGQAEMRRIGSGPGQEGMEELCD